METEAHRLLASEILDPASGLCYNLVTQANVYLGLHAHDFYEVFLMVEGTALHCINGERQVLRAGTLVLIRPDDTHAYEMVAGGRCQFINVAFETALFEALMRYLGDPSLAGRLTQPSRLPHVSLAQTEAGLLRARLSSFALLPHGDAAAARLQFRLLLAEIVRLLLPEQEAGAVRNHPAWFADLLVRMREQACFSEGLPAMVRISGKSAAYLSRVFRRETGETPTDHVNALRLNYAANLLAQSDTEVLGICLDAGFGNASHFHHLFKARFGMSPQQYRRSCRLPATV